MFTTRPELRGTFGMVSSTHWLASVSGMAALEAGGNAFDSAVVAGMVLQVVKPHVNGPGGEVPILLYSADRDRVIVINGQGPAPADATIDAYHDLGLAFIPGRGLLSATVPGAFDAWMRLLAEHGTFTLRQALAHAIGYASDGYPVIPGITDDIVEAEARFRTHWPTSADVYLRDGIPTQGRLFRNPDLGATYERVVREAEASSNDRDTQIQAARDVFYRGFVAEAIHQFIAGFGSGEPLEFKHQGFLGGDDLARYEARVEEAESVDYHEYTVFKVGPSTQGPVFLQQLRLLEGFDLASLGHNTAQYIHTIVECAKLAFADREAWYGDQAFVDVPLDTLLSTAYADERRPLVDSATASGEFRPGAVNGREPPPLPAHLVAAGDSTCYVAVGDRHGNLVSAMPSGGLLKLSPVVPGLGFGLSERAQAFYLDESHPNSLVPGKLPRTTLTPSIAFKDGAPYMAFGTPGGDRQDQWSLSFFLGHADFGFDLQHAIDVPLYHSTHWPRSFYPHDAYPRELIVEASMPLETREGLRKRGHKIVLVDEWTLGWVSAVAREPDGVLKAAASPREMKAYAVGR
jgi:gamma-glutamyltranspeptidase/glutathione hydrolase